MNHADTISSTQAIFLFKHDIFVSIHVDIHCRYVALLLVYNLQLFLETRWVKGKGFSFIKVNKVHIVPFLLVSAVLYEPVRRVLMYGNLDFGGKAGFYADTVSHLIWNTCHQMAIPPAVLLVLQIVFTLIVLVPLFLMMQNGRRARHQFFDQHRGLIITNLLLILLAMIIIAQHWILKSDYPISRFSIFLFPLFMVHFGYLLHYFMASKYKFMLRIGFALLALGSTISFCSKTELDTLAEWGYDSATKEMIQTLATHRASTPHPAREVKLGIDWSFEPTINFYRQVKQLDWLLPADREGLSANDDYYYIFKDQLPQLEPTEYEIIKVYEKTKTVLIFNKNYTDSAE